MSFPREFPRSLALLGLAIALLIGVSSVYALREARAAGGEPLLPHLVADPPDETVLETSSVEGSSRLLLRFNGYIHNVGPGAVDFRGSREKPKVSKATEERVERAREKKEGLPQKTEEELASPPMEVVQRLFTTNVGQEETNIERAHVDEASSGEILYASADGHHHWHLQKVAKYSLWNASKTAEVAPAQKVGFCLDDSQQVESNVGPSTPVYADQVPPFRDFCQQYRPNATSLFEGISPGWRDIYDRGLAFQWVDASDVAPGEYWLREDVNPLGIVKETGGAKIPVYSTSSTIIPGFDALAQSTNMQAGEAKTITLTSKAWGDATTPRYSIVSQPQHGTLGVVSANHVTYTPNAGYIGPDSFTFSSADPNSQFPTSPAIATVSIEVTEASTQPSVTIEGAPPSMTAGSSVQLSAHVSNDSPTVTWSASAGSITTGGSYTAPSEPPVGATVTVSATTSKGAKDQRTIEVTSAGGQSLLAGDASTAYSVGNQTSNGREEAFQFTAKSTGTVEELQFRTNATANTGVSGLNLGVFAESAGTPGEVLGRAMVSGQPATSSWIKATGLSVAVVAGTRYWLVVLPVGEGGKHLHFNAAVGSGGTGNLESAAGGLSGLTQEAAWDTFNQGPVGFQAIGRETAQPSVTIEGAPARIAAGSSVQLSAHVSNDSPTVTWSASGGSISTGGSYTAPSEPPAGATVTVSATTSKGAKDQRTIEITPAGSAPGISISGAQAEMTASTSVTFTAAVSHDSGGVQWSATAGSLAAGSPVGLSDLYTAPSGATTVTITARLRDRPSVSAQLEIRIVAAPTPSAAPEIPTSASTASGSNGNAGFKVSNAPGVSRPRVMLFGRKLVMSTLATVGGRVRLSAYLARRLLGTCVASTPAGRTFTCRLMLGPRISLRARIRVLASLRIDSLIFRSSLPAEQIPQMKMKPAGLSAHASSAGGQFWCSPSTLVPTLSSEG